MSWPDRGHRVPALSVTSGERGVGFDMHAYLPTARRGVGRMVSLRAGVGLPFSPNFFIMGLSFLTGLYFCWGYMVGRSGFSRFPEVRPHRRRVLLKRPWSLRGSGGYAPHGYMGLMAGYAVCCSPYTRCCPLVPVQSQPAELPATTVGEWWRHHSL